MNTVPDPIDENLTKIIINNGHFCIIFVKKKRKNDWSSKCLNWFEKGKTVQTQNILNKGENATHIF